MSLFSRFAGGTSAIPPASGAQPDIIEAEVVPNYFAVVKERHNGYSFATAVRRGSTESIATEGDIFLPQEFEPGVMVEFVKLSVDERRSKDGITRYRGDVIREVKSAMVVVGGTAVPTSLVLHQLNARSAYHRKAKQVNPKHVEQAGANGPFAEIAALAASLRADDSIRTPEDLINETVKGAEEFLGETFAMVEQQGFSSSLTDPVDPKADDERLKAAAKRFNDAGMPGQASSLNQEYRKFAGIRTAFRLMTEKGLLRPDTVIPMKHLPDMLMACPVLYGEGQRLSFPTQFLDQVPTREFATLAQIYNMSGLRPFNTFSGRDIMPPHIMEIVEASRPSFDLLVIATPYHDLATSQWNVAWQRNLDPYLLGFMQGVPYFFVLGRWSGTGLFPLLCDMIADTVDHLRLYAELLGNYRPNDTRLYDPTRGSNDRWVYLKKGKDEQKNATLPEYAKELIAHFEKGDLFPWLNGEVAKTA